MPKCCSWIFPAIVAASFIATASAQTRIPPDQGAAARTTRRVRMVQGERRYDPLRTLHARSPKDITADHVMAADKFRELVDHASLGYSGSRSYLFIVISGSGSPQPYQGLDKAAILRNRANRALKRVAKLFDDLELALLSWIVLEASTLSGWAHVRGLSVPRERRRLIAILDKLYRYFRQDLQNEVASGRRLPLDD